MVTAQLEKGLNAGTEGWDEELGKEGWDSENESGASNGPTSNEARRILPKAWKGTPQGHSSLHVRHGQADTGWSEQEAQKAQYIPKEISASCGCFFWLYDGRANFCLIHLLPSVVL